MSTPRIFQACSLATGETLILDPKASHHLARVLRVKIDDHIIIFNGQGGEFATQICAINKHAIIVTIGTFHPQTITSPCQIHLGQAISKSASMDMIIQKTVELGVHSITPLISQHCSVKINPLALNKRIQHWQAIAIHASEQCGRDTIPIINPTVTLATWLQQASFATKLLLDPTSKLSLENITIPPTHLDCLVGPEGGFSPTEIQLATQYDYTAICLGPRILRCETATLTAISLFQYRWGDLT